MPHARMLASRNTYTWIQKYIFPGGMLPSTQAILGITEQQTRLRTVDMVSLRPHYAETLRLWRERFGQRRDAVLGVGFRREVSADVGALPGLLGGRLSRPVTSMSTNGRSPRREPAVNFVVVAAARWRPVVTTRRDVLIGRRIGRYNVVDVAWGLALWPSPQSPRPSGTGDLFRRLLLLA